MALSTGWATDVGRRRSENQDAILVQELDPAGALLAAVADGMGGLASGSIASVAAIAALEAVGAPELGPEALVAAYREANRLIHEGGVAAGETRGTTLLAVIARQGSIYVANVGDCRAYLVSGDAIVQVTTDHSLVTEQLEAGLIDAEEARSSSMRNVLTRALGPDTQAPQVDVFGPLLLRRGDVIVLCSDGLHTLVEPDEIAEAVRELEPQEAADSLVLLANERGGFDNISVVVIEMAEDALR